MFLADRYGLGASVKAFTGDRMAMPGRALTTWGTSLVHAFGSLGSFYALGEENERLRDEQRALLAELATLRREQELASFKQTQDALIFEEPLDRIDTYVVGEDSLFAPSYFILDKGSSDGVVKGMAVIDEYKALIGRIEDTTEHTARMGLVNNFSTPLLVAILDRDISGVIEEGDSHAFTIGFLDKRGALQEGDLVVTSGKDGLPRGLIVGTIEDIKSEEGMVFQEVRGNFMTHPREVDHLIILAKRP